MGVPENAPGHPARGVSLPARIGYHDGTAWVRLGADNLGSHTATQNVDLAGNQLVGNGGTSGLSVDGVGNVGVGTSGPSQKLEVRGSVFANGEGTGFLIDNQAPRVGLLKYPGREGGSGAPAARTTRLGASRTAAQPSARCPMRPPTSPPTCTWAATAAWASARARPAPAST